MTYRSIFSFLFIGLLLVLPFSALAFCPLCVVATGALTGVFRWLGVDDLIIGLWLGGFVFSTSITAGNYLRLNGKCVSIDGP